MKKTFSIIAFLCILFLPELFAQTIEPKMKREIGIRMPGINLSNITFNFIYKKQKTEDKYRRVRLITGDINFNDIKGFKHNFSLSMAVGKEKRKPLTEKLYWIRGWEFIGSLSESNQTNFNVSLNPGIGIVLGLQYNINDKFRINIETIPMVSTSLWYTGGNKEFRVNGVNANFNSNSVAFGLLYAF